MNTGHLDNLRFQYERWLFNQLNSSSALSPILGSIGQDREDYMRKRYLLSTSAKITEALLPDLYRLYQECLTYVGVELTGNLYVQQNSQYNAFIDCSGNCFNIVVSSSIIKDFDTREIAFVIGHELGHVIFGHNKIPAGFFFSGEMQIPHELIHMISSWSKASEISADRLGLLCCGNLRSAASAFFKLVSGLCLEDDEAVIRCLSAQYNEVKAISEAQWLSDDISTHPLIPIRYKSLELVALDVIALRGQRDKVMLRGFDDIDAQITKVLIGSDPFEYGSVFRSREGGSLLVLSLLYVAVCDGELNAAEESFIRRLNGKSGFDLNIDEVIANCKAGIRRFRDGVIAELRGIKTLSGNDVTRLLDICRQIAICDGALNTSEVDGLGRVAQALGG
ncbi:MAG: M48 family metalloprotease [Nitrospirae bacterium]|uniref:M48 family metallopeptidase n=1 Tax=Candidatus Magnetobacterium casense TaxID=1455061 RepID=UPI00058CB7FF|nr:M48 family metallopeptidase [Candidatus Magnetobacterium casensis]MBF0337334.1 M48 family metalloprotease [Nitrospirota bacterium]